MILAYSIALTILSSICASAGQIALKYGSMKLKITIESLMKNYALMTGLFFYGLSSIIFIIALKGAELSVLYPLASLNYVWVSLLSMKLLKEKMNKYKWAGIAVIIIGVTLVI